MSHPEIQNKTPFIFEALFLIDEDLRPLAVPIVKATFSITPNGACKPAEKQVHLNMTGEYWGEDPETSSLKYEPEVAFTKVATDVVMIGHAYADRRDTRQVQVGVRVGSIAKDVTVHGDRVWFKSGGSIAFSRAQPFEKIPLTYERAFGGWDRSHPDPLRHMCERRNPVGKGYCGASNSVEGVRLPNIEDSRTPIKDISEKPAPAGFGFLAPHWEPRSLLVGTFDDQWKQARAPRLPKNFDRRHFSAASAGLVAPGYLRGDEPVTVVGATKASTLAFALPAIPPPMAKVSLVAGPPKTVLLNLDTVIIEPDDLRLTLLWRNHVLLTNGPHDVRAIVAGG